MSNDSMGNLEKLGILVIVILVVVVGVVAITPSDTLFGEGDVAELPNQTDQFDPVPERVVADREVRPPVEPQRDPWRADGGDSAGDPWPIDIPDEDQLDHPEVVRSVDVPAVTPIPAPEPVVLVEAPRYREITVQKNDSLWRIAERELGKGSLWGELARANPSLDPDRLQAGQKLRIPLEIGVPTAPVVDRSERPTGVKAYTVKKGDTPMGVSSLHYGTVRHYRVILDHNGLDEDGFQAGMTIEIPPLPEKASNLAPVRDSSNSRAAPTSRGERFYEVKKGDFPTTIAREQLGDESRWREILRLNGIDDDRGLIAGSRIQLPSR